MTEWDAELEKSLLVALCYGATTFLLCAAVWSWFLADMWWLVIITMVSMAVFFSARAGWLTRDVDKELKELQIAHDEQMKRFSDDYKNLLKANSELKREIISLRQLTKTKPQKVRMEVVPEPVPELLYNRPRNAEAALRIHQQWLLDPSGGQQINRERLRQLTNLSREEIGEGWILLNALGFARKEDDRPNAKWIVINTDSHDLSVEIDRHITSAIAGMVHNI